MRRTLVCAIWALTGLAGPLAGAIEAQTTTPPAAPTVQPLPPTPAPGTIVQPAPGTVVVQPAPAPAVVQPAPGTVVVQPPPGTVVVQPAPGVVVQPAPGTVVVQPAPGVVVPPAAPPVGTPLNCPECRGALIQGQRYLPPSVSVCIPGPPNYGPGPFLVSRYNALAGPPYPLPAFVTPGAALVPMPGVRPTISVTYVAGRTSEITITAPSGETFPADVRVQTVTDPAHQLAWDVKSSTLSPDRRTLTVVVEGKGLPKGATPPENGSVTVTLTGPGTVPTLQPVPVVYVVPR